MMVREKDIQLILSGIRNKWNGLILLKVLVLSISISWLVFEVIVLLNLPSLFAVFAFVLLFALFSFAYGLGKIPIKKIAQLLDRQVPDLEDSSTLLFEKNLSPIAAIQRELVAERVKQNSISINYPVAYKGSLILIVLSLLAATIINLIKTPSPEVLLTNQQALQNESVPSSVVPTKISDFQIEITPPAYTQLSKRGSNEFHLEIPANSKVVWEVTFNKPVTNADLVWGINERFAMKGSEQKFKVSTNIAASGFYSFSIISQMDTLRTEYYRVDVIPDLPPKISGINNELYSRVSFDQNLSLPVRASISDDYGVSDAYIVATVSKGAGEGVKFREQRVKFNEQIVNRKSSTVTANILGSALHLEPGSELYYYIEAWDNKSPNPNRSRTETYFLEVEDTVDVVYGDMGGLAVDLMPDYFRSQRQIIIETEKLIKDKPKLPEKDFKFISNELGFDQKVLRLKYSQFLGEEFESGIELEDDQTPQPDEALMILEETHEHDEELDPNAEEDPLEAVSHEHDTEEETSYFSISVETKLRAALVEMWDAELQLRLYEPQKSLPYQYRALELIKEIKNHARIFVKRVGFEPPPLTEEKRLSGKQSEINPAIIAGEAGSQLEFPNLRLATSILDNVILSGRQLTENEKLILKACGNEIAYFVDTNPLAYLDILQSLKLISESKSQDTDQMKKLKRDFYKILANTHRESGHQVYSEDPLKANYFKNQSNK